MEISVGGVLALTVAAAYLPSAWQGQSGRGMHPWLLNTGILLFLFAAVLRGVLRYPVLDFFLTLLIMEAITLWIISYYSGFTGIAVLNSFNRSWFFGISLFVAPPWLAGLGVGSLVLAVRNFRARRFRMPDGES